MRKERNKLKPADLAKIRARFDMKYAEFETKPLHDELNEDGTIKTRGLRTIFREDKMSSTDKRALVAVVDSMLRKQMTEGAEKKATIGDEVVDGTEEQKNLDI